MEEEAESFLKSVLPEGQKRGSTEGGSSVLVLWTSQALVHPRPGPLSQLALTTPNVPAAASTPVPPSPFQPLTLSISSASLL